jgi:hypothetical protein
MTGLVPSKIVGLGVEFQAADQRWLLAVVAAVIVYFLFAFVIYAASDLMAWRVAIIRQIIDIDVERCEEDYSGHFPQPGSVEDATEKLKAELYTRFCIYFRLVTPMSIIRALFDFGLPVGVGGYSLFLGIRGAIGIGTWQAVAPDRRTGFGVRPSKFDLTIYRDRSSKQRNNEVHYDYSDINQTPQSPR